MKKLTAVVATLAGIAAAAGAGAVAFVWSGLYDIAATTPHTQPIYTLLETVGRQSIRRAARNIAEPPLDDPAQVRRGAACYRDKCLVCHGGPGVAQGEIGRSMQPLPGPLVDAKRSFRPRELYWVIRHGIKMSGMPAWQYRMADADMWAVVAFMERLPAFGAAAFRAETVDSGEPPCTAADGDDSADARPDAARGRAALTQFACNACHTIPGVTGAQVNVGPPLAGLASRRLIAGRLDNTLDNRVLWIRHPQRVDPETTMPGLDVGERDARDMAAYLGTLH